MTTTALVNPVPDGDRGRRRVLFVDDERRILDGIRRSLQTQRRVWEMEFVESGTEALEAMSRAPYDVIVSDFRMPGLDGGQLLRLVQERHPDTARLMLSGHTDSADLLDAMTVTHRFLDKPCERSVLVAAIENGLWLRDALAGAPIRAELGALASLPTGDSTLFRLQRTLDTGTESLLDLAGVVESDIGLTVKVLQLASSSAFGLGGETSSVAQALSTIGVPALRALVLMRDLFAPIKISSALSQSWLERVNTHASVAGQVARRLVSPDLAAEACCAAVVEECGQLALASCRPERMSSITDEAGGRAGRLAELELAEFGISHAEAGAYLLSLWGFPPAVVQAVAEHDLASAVRPSGPSGGGPLDVAAAVRVAREVAEWHVTGVCQPTAVPHLRGWLEDPRCHIEPASVAGWRPADLSVESTQ